MIHFRFLFRRLQEVKSDWSFQVKWVLIIKILTDLSALIADPVTFVKQEIKKPFELSKVRLWTASS